MQAKSVDVSEGLNWFGCGWQLFKRSPAMWIVLFIAAAVIGIVLSIIPFLGIVFLLISPAIYGGFYLAAKSIDGGGDIDIMMLFEGLRNPKTRNPLLILGAILVALTIVSVLVIFVMVGGSAMMGMMMGQEPQAGAGAGMVLGLLVLLAVELLIVMAMFYAIPLVMLDNVAPVDAVQISFGACLKNILPFLVFGVVFVILAVIAAIPFGLGFLVLIPVTMCAIYCSYKAVFK